MHILKHTNKLTWGTVFQKEEVQRLLIIFGILILLAAPVTGCLNSDSSNSDIDNGQPNIVYILADDLGYGELGAYGQQKIETPNIDKLAAEGMIFTQHYAGSPVCAPSRYMLMTGKHPGNAYIRGNDGMPERGDVWDFEAMRKDPGLEGQRPIPDSTYTMAEMLSEAGYRTAAIGKWGLGGPGTEGHPNEQGFDLFYGYLCQRQAHNYYPDHLWKNRDRVFLDNIVQNPHATLPDSLDPYDPDSYKKYQEQPDYAPSLMQQELLSFIEESKNAPFFLYFASPIPHVSLQAPDRWVRYYRQKFGDELPYTGDRGYVPNRYPRATYAAMISYLDEQVGDLVEKLKQEGIYGNTLIIFSSDNGPTYNGGTQPEFFNSAGPFNNSYGWTKGFTHEGGIRVPMISHWPGVIEAGTETDHISAFWDVMPTLADIIGRELPGATDGISFAPLLRGNVDRQITHDFLYWEFPAYGGQQAVRMGKWKGIRKNIVKEGNMDIALYNLENDLREEHDVAAQHPEVVRKIQEIMRQEHSRANVETFRMNALNGSN